MRFLNEQDDYVLQEALVSGPSRLSYRIPGVANTEKCGKTCGYFWVLEQSLVLETSLMNLGSTG